MTHLSVMTYNILQGGRRGAPLDQLVRQVSPDILLVNEAPKQILISGRRCRQLADRWGLRYVDGGRRAGSNMILTDPAIATKWSREEVLKQPFMQPRRGIASAQLKVRGRLVGVVSCHLSLVADRRLEEITRVLAAADRLRGPVFLAGDLNERPGGPVWDRLLRAGFEDHGHADWKTFPSEEPRARIDALLVRRGNVLVEHHGDPGVPERLQVAASDHRPVLARVVL